MIARIYLPDWVQAVPFVLLCLLLVWKEWYYWKRRKKR